MIADRRLSLPWLGLLLMGLSAGTAQGFANPSLGWSLGYPPYNVTSNQAHELATKFDMMTVEPGNENFTPLVRTTNSNFKFLRYDNVTNNNHGSHRDKWTDIQNYCMAHGVDFERMWLHFSEDTRVSLNNDTPTYYLFSGGSAGGTLVFSGGNLTDQSYWGTGSAAGTSYTFCAHTGDIVYLGHYDKYSAVDVGLAQTASSDWNGVWEYLRSDSLWVALPATDGTSKLTQAGQVKFAPPSDWGWLSVGGSRNYWTRCRCTSTPTTAPKWSHMWKDSYVTPSTGGLFNVPGWDSRNDANSDGWVSDVEFGSRINPNCSARFKYQARIPTFYWNSQRDVANVGDPVYRQLNATWMLGHCNADFGGGQHLDGIMEDNCVFNDGSVKVLSDTVDLGDSLRVGRYNFSGGGHILEYPGQGPGRRFHQDHLRADSTCRAVLNAGGKLFEGNGSQFYSDWRGYNFPPTAVTTITQGDSGAYFAFSDHDGCFREFWAIPKTCVVEGGFDSPTVCASAQFKMAKELTSHGHFARFMMRASYDDPQYGPSTLYHDRDRMFSLAYCAMVSGPTSYGGYMPVGAISPPESTQWWPAVGYDFGTPQSDSIYTFQTGTDSRGEAYVIYARYFTKGLVLIKPKPHYNSDISETSSPVTVVNLPVSLRRLNVDGTLGPAVTQVSLKNIESAIMIGSVTPSGGGGGGDTIPPTPTTVAYTFRVDDGSPANQSIAPSHTNIKVNLNDVIDKSTVTASTVQATGSISGAHSGAISAVGRYLTFTPSTPFTINEVVTVRVSSTLKSITGHNLDGDGDGQGGGDKVWTFTVSDH